MKVDVEVKKRFKYLFFIVLIALILSIGYSLFCFYFPEYGFLKCIFHEITDLKCPGCGITRMIADFIMLDFIKGLKLNLFIGITLPILLGIFIYSAYLYVFNKKSKRLFNIICYCYVVLLLVWGIVRNIVEI